MFLSAKWLDNLGASKRAKKNEEQDEDWELEDYTEVETDGIPDVAKKNIEKQDVAIEDEFGAKDYRKQMVLKQDHASRPLWVVSINFYKFIQYIFHRYMYQEFLFL